MMQSQQPYSYPSGFGAPGSLDRILFMRPVLEAISRPPFLRRVFAWGLRVVAVLLVLAAAIAWLQLWQPIFSIRGAGILGGILFQALFAVAIYMVAHTVFIRAADITNLDDTDFVVIPIFSIMLRLLGEMYALFLAIMGIAGCVLLWFAGMAAPGLMQFVPMLPGMGWLMFIGRGNESFLAGLMFLAGSVIAAFFALVFFYMLAELMVVTVRIASNTRITKEILERNSRV